MRLSFAECLNKEETAPYPRPQFHARIHHFNVNFICAHEKTFAFHISDRESKEGEKLSNDCVGEG